MDEHNAEIVATCEAAITHLTEVGHTHGKFIDTAGKACLTGALLIAEGKRELVEPGGLGLPLREAILACPTIPAVADVIREQHPERIDEDPDDITVTRHAWVIYDFNDHEETEVGDVIDVLRETIKRHVDDTVR